MTKPCRRVVIACLMLLGCAGPAAGAEPDPPVVTSLAWFGWYHDLLAARLAYCPRERSRTFYLSQSGDDLSGKGTIDEPFRSLVRAQSLIRSSRPGDGVAVLFKRGDVWRSTTGLDCDAPEVTIGEYGDPGLPKPLITRFEPIDPSGWSPRAGTVNTYERAESAYVSWVKETEDLDRAYARVPTADDVERVEGSWNWSEDARTLCVHPFHDGAGRATDPRVDGKPYELTRPSAHGVVVRADGVRIENIRAQGWGMTREVGTQQHNFESRVGGSDQSVFVGCDAHYGLAHGMTHWTVQGGRVAFVGCTSGLLTPVGTETVFNVYAENGGNRDIFDGCVATHGTMADSADAVAGRRAIAFFGHTASPVVGRIGLAVAYGCRVRDARIGCQSPAMFDFVPTPSKLEDVRAFIVGEVFEGGDGTGGGFQAGVFGNARVNGRYLNLRPQQLATGALAAFQSAGWVINCTIEVDATRQAYDLGLYNAYPKWVNYPRFWNCAVHVATRSRQEFRIDWDMPGQSDSGQFVNSILSNSGPGGCKPNIGGSSGLLSNAYFGCDPSGVDADPRRVFLKAAPGVDAAPSCRWPTACDAAPLPGGYVLEYDQTGHPRTRADIGPIESGPCGDFNDDGALNVNDFIAFQAAWRAGDARADFDADGKFTINDFVALQRAFTAGCR